MPMFELVDRDGVPTPHKSENPKELTEIAQSIWPNQEPDTSDGNGQPNGWSLQVAGFVPPST